MDKVFLTIDGHRVEAEKGQPVMQAALAAGIYIPHLCAHDDLVPAGSCRLCVVEIEGLPAPVTSCSTMAEDGMVVTTVTSRLKQMRRLAAELLLAPHPSECTSCPKYLKCELQSLIQYLEVTDQRIRKRPNMISANLDNPLIIHDMYRCITCGRCVRACNELRGIGAINYKEIDGRVRIAPVNGTLADSGCKFCGACIEVCPTGSIIDQLGVIKPELKKSDYLVPCRYTCPAGIDIPRYLRLVKEGKPAESNAVIREKVPFPSVLGHICNHLCEDACRRGPVNEAIAIKEVKRYAAMNDDGQWRERSFQKPATGKKVAVIGSGPAGLTAAFYLAKLGHQVTIFEELPYSGGMMRVGIPKYRLPWAELDKEIDIIRETGVEIKTGVRIESAPELLKQGFNAVLAATGAHQGIKLPIPGNDLEGILINTTFLRKVSLGEPVAVGERVVVLGGGNVAFDCAGAARRLGAKTVSVVCLESREEMKASDEEVQEALEEGTAVHPSISFTGIVGENGRVAGVSCSKVCSFFFDEQGRAQIVCEIGSEHIIPADTIIFAVGQRPAVNDQFGLPLVRGNRIEADRQTTRTPVEGVFAAGDVVYGTLSVIEAIESGRRAAKSIDTFLGGEGKIDEQLAPAPVYPTWFGREEGFAAKSRIHATNIDADQRSLETLVCQGYTTDEAWGESERCLQCDVRLNISRSKFWNEYEKK
ncbi:MAG TPA: ferredoxin [Clostridiales bacterium]|nr:ferredoxin [Clostridiales bacterium]